MYSTVQYSTVVRLQLIAGRLLRYGMHVVQYCTVLVQYTTVQYSSTPTTYSRRATKVQYSTHIHVQHKAGGLQRYERVMKAACKINL